MSKSNKYIVIVLGMHRSGTSAMTGAISLLGVGGEGKFVEAVPNDNPKGYWEEVDVVNINDDIFAAFDMHYMDFSSFPSGWVKHEAMNPIRQRISDWLRKSFSDRTLIVVKDPRLCRTFPLWVDVLEHRQVNIKCIHVFRHPMEVVGSLRVRDTTFPVVEGLLVWLSHVLDLFVSCSLKDNSIVSYGELMSNPVLALETIGLHLDLEWPLKPGTMVGSLEDFLEPSLVHQQFEGSIPYPPLGELVQSVFDCLKSSDLKSPNKDFYSRIVRYQRQFQEFRGLFECVHKSYFFKLEVEKANAKEQVEYRDSLLVELEEQLDAERLNAKEQVEYRDSLLVELEEQLDAERLNAKEQIEYRNAMISELEEKMSSKSNLVRCFFRTFMNEKS